MTGTTASLSVLGADADGGESNLSYTWTTTSLPSGAAGPVFSVNGNNGAKATTVVFSKAGVYEFLVTIVDQGGSTTSSSVSVTVDRTLTTIVVSPASGSLNAGGTQQFRAAAYDQFGVAWESAEFAWASSVGHITAEGLLTASDTSATGTVTASSGSVSGSGAVTVTNSAPTVVAAAAATPGTVTGTTTMLSVLGADVEGEAGLTYSWTATLLPSGRGGAYFQRQQQQRGWNNHGCFPQGGKLHLPCRD